MALTCRNLLKIPYASKIELVAGEEGLGNVVQRTHILEIIEYMDFVQKGDFIITLGYVMNNDKDKWQEFISRLFEKEIAALAIDTERLNTDTVRMIRELCEKNSCPLFIMPVEMRIPDLQESISKVLHEESMKSMLAEKFFLELMYNNSPVSLSKIKKAEKYGFDMNRTYYFIDIEILPDKDFDLQDGSKIRQTYKGISGDIYTIYDENPVEQLKTILYGCLAGTGARSYIIVNGERLTALVSPNPLPIQNVADNICAELKELELDYRIGVSTKTMGLENMNICYGQSVFARHRCDGNDRVKYFETFGIEAIIHNSIDAELLNSICESFLGAVLGIADEIKREEILNTLNAFIEHNCSYDETAEVLYCHSNTVRNRISDIEKRLGISHTNLNDMFNINLALAIYKNHKQL